MENRTTPHSTGVFTWTARLFASRHIIFQISCVLINVGLTANLLWTSTICQSPDNLYWPASWRDALYIYNATVFNSTTFTDSIPLELGGCSMFVTARKNNCTVHACAVDGNNCTTVGNAVSGDCFCKGMNDRYECQAVQTGVPTTTMGDTNHRFQGGVL